MQGLRKENSILATCGVLGRQCGQLRHGDKWGSPVGSGVKGEKITGFLKLESVAFMSKSSVSWFLTSFGHWEG